MLLAKGIINEPQIVFCLVVILSTSFSWNFVSAGSALNIPEVLFFIMPIALHALLVIPFARLGQVGLGVMLAMMLLFFQIGNLFITYFFMGSIVSMMSPGGHDGVISSNESFIAIMILPVFVSAMLGLYLRSLTNKWNKKFETTS